MTRPPHHHHQTHCSTHARARARAHAYSKDPAGRGWRRSAGFAAWGTPSIWQAGHSPDTLPAPECIMAQGTLSVPPGSVPASRGVRSLLEHVFYAGAFCKMRQQNFIRVGCQEI